jgi:glycosyltransferase involved in cell wall biosynthesis
MAGAAELAGIRSGSTADDRVGDEPAPQRLLLVLSSTALFDSRTHRIATSATLRGHRVTVLARWEPGLAREEVDATGYRVIRVPVSAVDGLPVPHMLRQAITRFRNRRRIGLPADSPMGRTRPTGPASSDSAGLTTDDRSSPNSGNWLRQFDRHLVGPIRRFGRAVVRVLAIALTVRSQLIAARRIGIETDLYHAMGYMAIPVALSLGRRSGAPVVYDARDIYVNANNLARMVWPIRWVLARIERGWARRSDRVVTVNRGYAEVMARRWDITLPAIVMNCSPRTDPRRPRPRRFHAALDLEPGSPVVLYQGGFSPHRGIEQLIDAIEQVPLASLVLLGYGPLAERITKRGAEPRFGGRVHVMPAVRPADLLEWVASADIVAMPIEASTLNHRLTTPNKLFEALAAGVPIIASDLPGMAAIVRETGAGLLVDPTSPGEIATAIRQILDGPVETREAMAARGLAAAHATYNWESQVAILFAEYGSLTGRTW